MFKKIISSIMALAIIASIGTTVMAGDASSEKNYIEVSSFTEDLGDGTFTKTTLSIKASSLARGFIGTKSVVVSKDTYNTIMGEVGGTIHLYVDFFSDSAYDANVCYVGQYSHSINNYAPGRYDINTNSVSYSIENNQGWIGNKYAKCNANYYYSNNNGPMSGDVWAKCDSAGSISTSRKALAENEYMIGNDIITFG